MFLNHRPLLVLLLFLATSPVDVLTTVLHSNVANNPDSYPDKHNETEALNHLENVDLFVNPLHILCPVCSLLQFLLGGILSTLLGNNLLKQVGILGCALVTGIPIHIPFVPNILCTAIVEVCTNIRLPHIHFQIVFILTKKTGNGVCAILLLCPMKKKIATPQLTAEDAYEQKIVDIIENRDSANLSPQMEFFYRDLLKEIPLDNLKGTGVEETARHVLRNLVAAIEFHSAHREEYLAVKTDDVE